MHLDFRFIIVIIDYNGNFEMRNFRQWEIKRELKYQKNLFSSYDSMPKLRDSMNADFFINIKNGSFLPNNMQCCH